MAVSLYNFLYKKTTAKKWLTKWTVNITSLWSIIPLSILRNHAIYAKVIHQKYWFFCVTSFSPTTFLWRSSPEYTKNAISYGFLDPFNHRYHLNFSAGVKKFCVLMTFSKFEKSTDKPHDDFLANFATNDSTTIWWTISLFGHCYEKFW